MGSLVFGLGLDFDGLCGEEGEVEREFFFEVMEGVGRVL